MAKSTLVVLWTVISAVMNASTAHACGEPAKQFIPTIDLFVGGTMGFVFMSVSALVSMILLILSVVLKHVRFALWGIVGLLSSVITFLWRAHISYYFC